MDCRDLSKACISANHVHAPHAFELFPVDDSAECNSGKHKVFWTDDAVDQRNVFWPSCFSMLTSCQKKLLFFNHTSNIKTSKRKVVNVRWPRNAKILRRYSDAGDGRNGLIVSKEVASAACYHHTHDNHEPARYSDGPTWRPWWICKGRFT